MTYEICRKIFLWVNIATKEIETRKKFRTFDGMNNYTISWGFPKKFLDFIN